MKIAIAIENGIADIHDLYIAATISLSLEEFPNESVVISYQASTVGRISTFPSCCLIRFASLMLI